MPPSNTPDPGDDLAFEALVDPTRRTILRLLARDGEMAAGSISSAITDIGRTAISNHLRILRTAGLISERRSGAYRYYSIDPGPTVGVLRFLAELNSTSLAELDSVVKESIDQAWEQSS